LADGTHVSQTMLQRRVYRDSQGRIRTEYPNRFRPKDAAAAEDVPIMIDIMDPVAQVRYVLDPQNKTAHRWAMIQPDAAPARRPAREVETDGAEARQHADPSGPRVQSERLARQMIEGLAVDGNRTTVTYPVGSEGNDREL